MDLKVYNLPSVKCKICDDKESVYLPLCRKPDSNELFMFPVCKECMDKVPYVTIPVTSVMDEGYFYCPHEKEPVFDPSRPILTKYGKRLLENGKRLP